MYWLLFFSSQRIWEPATAGSRLGEVDAGVSRVSCLDFFLLQTIGCSCSFCAKKPKETENLLPHHLNLLHERALWPRFCSVAVLGTTAMEEPEERLPIFLFLFIWSRTSTVERDSRWDLNFQVGIKGEKDITLHKPYKTINDKLFSWRWIFLLFFLKYQTVSLILLDAIVQ